MRPRLLFALALPGEDPDHLLNRYGGDVVVTGVGKVNAAIGLTRALAARALDDLVVVNLGSAGSHSYARGTTVCACRFFERDMDATMLGFAPGQTPFEEAIYIENALTVAGLPSGTCCTGDSFVTRRDESSRLDIIDMEAYALAKVCAAFGLPFASIKFITDGADDQAVEHWNGSVAASAAALCHGVERLLDDIAGRTPAPLTQGRTQDGAVVGPHAR